MNEVTVDYANHWLRAISTLIAFMLLHFNLALLYKFFFFGNLSLDIGLPKDWSPVRLKV